MIEEKSKTTDLAAHIHTKLNHSRLALATPPLTVLEELFECLFYTSMRTEEGELTKVAVTLIDPANPDPAPPRKIVSERWSCVEFAQRIPLDIRSLAKLSKAADPSGTSLAVYYDQDGKLFIWGMIDQAMHYQSFLNYESESGSEQPGLFQVFIDDIATLKVMFDYELLATLKQNVLVTRYLDVFTIGPVSKIIRKNAGAIRAEIKNFLAASHPGEDFADWEEFVDSIWTQTLSRLLLKIQNYHHGGAVLISEDSNDVDIKYAVNYKRLLLAISGYLKQAINSYITENRIDQRLASGKQTVTKLLYEQETIALHAKTEVANEIKGSVSFIASQSCVDGVVLFGQDMVARGFGGVIRSKKMPRKIYISATATATAKSLLPTDPKHFGTRHRSMIAYCWEHPGSLGIVVSQDGDIRVFSRIEDKLIMWENIKTQQYQKSGKLKATRS
ncbi:hypothetical protein SAMN04488511_11398 [Pedobacter suwonensis]|uniref:Probable sensor domain-containing protein n=1 Tax=Pedobacter suwonensis TaxID=332999 RepID=A0A1I0TRD1_9SPHI|nr:hypothetical protein [Pedobacter suwonensis]SFA54319.1 hypothetical protein SAMN04488511_11398 [Pedobacter suwonensis]